MAVLLTEKSGKTYKNRYFLTLQKKIDFPAASISRSVKPTPEGFEVRPSSDKLARAVFLSLSGAGYFFEDSCFDILPGQTVRVSVKTSPTEEEVSRQLRVTSLREAY